MKSINVISVCKTDCMSETYKQVKKPNGSFQKVLAYRKVTKAGWGMSVEITTLPNGKKVSKTIHGPIPK
jgi:hypothetical protein